VLARERVLHVAERRRCGSVGKRSLEPRARIGGVGAERVKPAFRFFLETVETPAGSWKLVAHETFLRYA
jgi:hypothetical protein